MKATISKPMQVVHSAINPISKVKNSSFLGVNNSVKKEIQFKAYQSACEKYRNEIEAIQKYFPGWMPDIPSF